MRAFGSHLFVASCLWLGSLCELDPTASAANRFSLLDSDRAAIAVRAAIIERAECEICLAYYAIDSGKVPLGMLALLRQAACRGVRVRVLVDGLQSRLPAELEAMLTREGVEFRKYHPPYEGHPGWLNRRLHDKLIVVDRREMIVGSRNLQDQHFGLGRTNYIDCDAYLEGEVCQQAAKYFNSLWQTDEVRPAAKTNSFGLDCFANLKMKALPGPFLKSRRQDKYNQALACSLRSLRTLVRSHEDGNGCSRLSTVADVDVCLLHDGCTDKSQRRLQTGVVGLIDSAQRSIHLESPYPVFSLPVLDALRRAARRGVCMELFTNSLKSTDHVSTYAAYQNKKRELSRLGVHLSEFCDRDHLHAKLMVVDSQCALIGSYNFDVRSDRLNLELCVLVCDPRVAADVLQSSRDRMRHAQKIGPHQCLPEVAGDTGPVKRLRLRITQAIVPLYRRSL